MPRSLRLGSITAAAAVWVAAIVLAPAAAQSSTSSAPRISSVIYLLGSIVCHQRPERSFHIGASQLPVCARCTALYAAGAAGLALWMSLAGLARSARPRAQRLLARYTPRTLLTGTAIPTVVTLATAALGWWDPDNVLRAISAVPLGLAAGALLGAVSAGDLR